MNQDLKEKIFFLCAARICVPQQLFRHHGNVTLGIYWAQVSSNTRRSTSEVWHSAWVKVKFAVTQYVAIPVQQLLIVKSWMDRSDFHLSLCTKALLSKVVNAEDSQSCVCTMYVRLHCRISVCTRFKMTLMQDAIVPHSQP